MMKAFSTTKYEAYNELVIIKHVIFQDPILFYNSERCLRDDKCLLIYVNYFTPVTSLSTTMSLSPKDPI